MKNKNSIFSCGLVYLLTCISSFANVFNHPTALNDIDIPSLNSINCKFKQEKIIKTSNIVLKSSGDFRFDKGKGITFYTVYPIKSVNSYTTKEYKQINNIVSAISNKSYSRLEKDFKFFYEKNGTNWTLGLMPKAETQAYNYLKSIEVAGNKTMIIKIVILPVDLNKTTIWFE